MTNLPITQEDYKRIFKVIKTVLDSMEADTNKSCLFFGIAGAWLLETIYKKKARPAIGAAFYRLIDNDVLSYAGKEGENFISSLDHFHCWTVCDGHIIDFMAPLFEDAMRSAGVAKQYPCKAFIKAGNTMAASPHDLSSEGDFFVKENQFLANHLIRSFLEKPVNGDLVNICSHWILPSPFPMQPELSMQDDLGEVTHMKLVEIELQGTW